MVATWNVREIPGSGCWNTGISPIRLRNGFYNAIVNAMPDKE